MSNTGTTLIDVKTKTPLARVQNIGLTPDVVIDNRAFMGPATVNFGAGAVLKSATFFATGPLTFTGGLTADRLAVGVTNGTVTFANPVNITGANPSQYRRRYSPHRRACCEPLHFGRPHRFLPPATDLALFALMGQRGLTPPGHEPNVQIFAQNGINITNPFVVGGPSPFTKMFSNGPFNISGLTTSASNMLAVFSPIDTTRAIFFEDEPFLQPPGASAFFNFPTIFGLPDNDGTTIVLGELGPAAAPLLTGSVTIGSNGSIDIGDRNMFIITRGAVTGGDLVSTSGILEIIGEVAATRQTPTVRTPTVNEFGEEPEDENEEDDELALVDEDDGGGDDGDVTEESDGSMEC